MGIGIALVMAADFLGRHKNARLLPGEFILPDLIF